MFEDKSVDTDKHPLLPGGRSGGGITRKSHYHSRIMRVIRRNSTTRIGLYVVLIALSIFLVCHIYTRKPVIYWRNTRQCVREIVYTRNEAALQVDVHGNTKEELVQAFLAIYDLKWEPLQQQSAAELTRSWYSCRRVHLDNQPQLGSVLKWLSTAPIVKMSAGVGGNVTANVHTGHGAKFEITFNDGSRAIFKPKMYDREEIEPGFEKYNMGPDRHNGEIASYHLQRLLGFNRAPLAVGRKIDVVRELVPVADSPGARDWSMIDKRLCMTMSIATRTKTTKSQICASEDGYLEGSLILWLPKPFTTAWFENPSLYPDNRDFLNPDSNKLVFPLKDDKTKLLDYIDGLLMDYLVQNPDRHIVEFFNGSYSTVLLVDNGKTFGDPETDHDIMLQVFQQRCQLRNSTYTRLKQLREGVLSTVLRHILSHDPIAPVLWDRHYEALDRRLDHLISVLDDCIAKYGSPHVLLKDNWPTNDWSTKLHYLV